MFSSKARHPLAFNCNRAFYDKQVQRRPKRRGRSRESELLHGSLVIPSTRVPSSRRHTRAYSRQPASALGERASADKRDVGGLDARVQQQLVTRHVDARFAVARSDFRRAKNLFTSSSADTLLLLVLFHSALAPIHPANLPCKARGCSRTSMIHRFNFARYVVVATWPFIAKSNEITFPAPRSIRYETRPVIFEAALFPRCASKERRVFE